MYDNRQEYRIYKLHQQIILYVIHFKGDLDVSQVTVARVMIFLVLEIVKIFNDDHQAAW